MRETRQSGSEGGARFNPCPYPYPLSPRFPVQRRPWQLYSRQMFQHRAGFAHRHLARQQRCHLLHPWRIARRLLQAQRGVRRKTPLAAPFAITPAAPDGDRPKPTLKAPSVIAREPAQWLLAHRADWRRQIGLLLRRPFSGHAQKLPALLLDLNLDITQALIAGD